MAEPCMSTHEIQQLSGHKNCWKHKNLEFLAEFQIKLVIFKYKFNSSWQLFQIIIEYSELDFIHWWSSNNK